MCFLYGCFPAIPAGEFSLEEMTGLFVDFLTNFGDAGASPIPAESDTFLVPETIVSAGFPAGIAGCFHTHGRVFFVSETTEGSGETQ